MVNQPHFFRSPKMDHGAYNVIYVDRRAREQTLRRGSASSIFVDSHGLPNGAASPDQFQSGLAKQEAEIQNTLDALLSTFTIGSMCLRKLAELEETPPQLAPVIVLIDIPYEEEAKTRKWPRDTNSPPPPSPRHLAATSTLESFETPDIYGLRLLGHIVSEIQFNKLSKMMIPIAMISGCERIWAPHNLKSVNGPGLQMMSGDLRLTRFIDAGAVDVLISPLSKARSQGLAVHAYRTLKHVTKTDHDFLNLKQSRKRSWVGIAEEKPYAYLREAMVSGLMSGICSPEVEDGAQAIILPSTASILDKDCKTVIMKAIGSWSFSAHDFSDDELLHAAMFMMNHTLSMPELSHWKISETCRASYNEFVHYHNFRHAVDVMQSVFFFLLQLDVLPRYPYTPKSISPNPLSCLIQPFEALTLLVSAIGHDVGHPGVNNAFLVSLNAPLAQLYNDRSVLESFHCAAFSQILRRHWPAAFEDATLRRLMINNILATDMGLHFRYMTDLGNLQQKLAHDAGIIEAWNAKEKEEYRDLICGLLIKCADISNVFSCAKTWANVLTQEFAHQGQMETNLGISTCLFGGPPVLGDLIKLAESQQGFMNIFACPLFENIANILPAMKFTVLELGRNQAIWEQTLAEQSISTRCTCGDSPICTCSKRKDSHRDTSPTSQIPNPLDECGSRLSTASSHDDLLSNTDRPNSLTLNKAHVINGKLADNSTLPITAIATPLDITSPACLPTMNSLVDVSEDHSGTANGRLSPYRKNELVGFSNSDMDLRSKKRLFTGLKRLWRWKSRPFLSNNPQDAWIRDESGGRPARGR